MKLSRNWERVIWTIAMIVLLGIAAFSFRAYVGPNFILDFANKAFIC